MLYTPNQMAVKVLVSAIGQHIIADVKQIENKETNDVVGYWLENPRVVVYNRRAEDESVSIGFANYCIVSDEQSFSVKADHIVAILEARDDVATKYNELVFPAEDNEELEVSVNESDSVDPVAEREPVSVSD